MYFNIKNIYFIVNIIVILNPQLIIFWKFDESIIKPNTFSRWSITDSSFKDFLTNFSALDKINLISNSLSINFFLKVNFLKSVKMAFFML